MKNIKLLTIALVLLISTNMLNGQKFEHRRTENIKDQILMKLDSIDLIYFSQRHSRDRFEVKRRIDDIDRLLDMLTADLRDKEQVLAEREKDLKKREDALEEREHFHDRDRDRNDGDREGRHHQEDVQVSPMNVQDFNQLLGSIDRTPFAQDKKKIINTSALNNYFLTDQVIRLASKFSFDNDKLDVIETLYSRILDLDKNYLLYNCFTFSDGKKKLERYINENSPNAKP